MQLWKLVFSSSHALTKVAVLSAKKFCLLEEKVQQLNSFTWSIKKVHPIINSLKQEVKPFLALDWLKFASGC